MFRGQVSRSILDEIVDKADRESLVPLIFDTTEQGACMAAQAVHTIVTIIRLSSNECIVIRSSTVRHSF